MKLNSYSSNQMQSVTNWKKLSNTSEKNERWVFRKSFASSSVLVLLEEREGIIAAKRETQMCKDKLNKRAERFLVLLPIHSYRYTMTLTLTHDAIHALHEDASYLKNQFQYVSTQVSTLFCLIHLHSKKN